MRKKRLWAVVFIFSLLFFTKNTLAEPVFPRLIAHAGGEVRGIQYSNSFEALEFNYALGIRYFEIDLNWTSDGQLVAIHDWASTYKSQFVVDDDSRVPSLDEFRALISKAGLAQMDIDELIRWLIDKRDAYLVTDVKSNNVKAISLIAKKYPSAIDKIIPQIYNFDEYTEAVRLGYKDIILTIYKMEIDELSQIDVFCTKNKVFAVTMPVSAAVNSPLAVLLNRLGVKVYAHTVNDFKMFSRLRSFGVYGIYTDKLRLP